ncbi:MAG: macro domain-containing protein [Chloroflexales bacterium]|nr:macro domain-containing protein [Chloroflexales bacterium]
MIEHLHGNLLDADVEALVNTVNTVGVMGKGIALQFRQAYPANFSAYQAACKRGEVVPGQMFVVPTAQLINPRYIINFPTKRHWRGKSQMEDIESGLEGLIATVRDHQIGSLAVPPLGCGNGGLNWDEVRPKIEAAFAELPEVRVLLYAPEGAPAPESIRVATES